MFLSSGPEALASVDNRSFCFRSYLSSVPTT